jgi:hypothetical protein
MTEGVVSVCYLRRLQAGVDEKERYHFFFLLYFMLRGRGRFQVDE